MDDMYKEELVERYKHPTHKKHVLQPTIKHEDSNPLCGDTIEISLRTDKNGKILKAGFEGKGCVISQASADILMEHIEGKQLEDVQKMTREDMLDLLGLNLTVSRIKCAMLPLTAIKKGILETKK